jgi:phage tail-like protein
MTTLGPIAAPAGGPPGTRTDPYLAFGFLVEVEGLVVGGFSEVTGLHVETVVETYREGGVNEFEHKLPGPTRYPSNVVLRHGLTDADTLWRWHQDVVRGKVERRNATVCLLDAARQEVLRWELLQAYPVRWTGPDLRADSATVAVESVELVHRGVSRPGTSPGQV